MKAMEAMKANHAMTQIKAMRAMMAMKANHAMKQIRAMKAMKAIHAMKQTKAMKAMEAMKANRVMKQIKGPHEDHEGEPRCKADQDDEGHEGHEGHEGEPRHEAGEGDEGEGHEGHEGHEGEPRHEADQGQGGEPRHGAEGGHEGGEDERLRIGDILFIEDPKRPWPYRMYRIGYGFYEGEVCVARLEEDTNMFENGMWFDALHCLKLEVYDFLDVRFWRSQGGPCGRS